MSSALVARHDGMMLAVPVGNLDAYINAVSSVPVLSAEDETELAWRFRRDNDLDAARQLVLSHLRFVVHIARGYNGYGLPLGDLVQEGNIGLMKAVKRFDPSVGVRLVSFAVHWIRAEIHEFVLRNWRLVKVATTKAQRKLFFNLRKAKQRLGWLSAEETRAVAEDLGVTPAEVNEMEQRLAARDMALDPAPDADDEERIGSPAHFLPAPDADPAELVARDDWEDNATEALGAALADLDERGRAILQRRWLSEQKATLQELAAEYGVSAERIRQLEAAAMKKLRAALAGSSAAWSA
ncbi:RNA polymerase sigma factor RpoH [Thioalkalivibrio sp. XN279]|uniref:RNA polymerase sigma factor RpoH n=1 Tax=Thioalkalivibrio sp. XN279 TaxID=2714953 RepID=UPI001408D12A|nr:RNA polymerase sigma factor RpoH [Thioalkalivibrio sp. XN279]NHA15689.1 RNA polymerase sigma factor RpoH [Thioalkalivibrio sp. XN279]